MAEEHKPVLLNEVLAALNIDPDGVYLDATYGRGGHSEEILKRLSSEGRLLVVDRDPAAIKVARERHRDDSRVVIEQGVFSNVAALAANHGFTGSVAGALFDLGVSSPQLDESELGFSFMRTGPLDMRMNPNDGQSAADWLATIDERDLVKILYDYGEERRAKAIAAEIVRVRATRAIKTTTELAEIICTVIKPRFGVIHPATRTFQAIRIAINDELRQLSTALERITELLSIGGRFAVISFHSLEDRIVKRFIRKASQVPDPFRGLPEIPTEYLPVLSPVGKLIKATAEEIGNNPRSRSARLRVAEKLR